MRTTRLLLALSAVGLSTSLVACGQAGSSTTTGGTSPSAGGSASSGASSAAATCRPATSQELVILRDDKNLQTVDNIIPAVNAKTAANPALVQALDKVSAALTTDQLVGLNRRVVVERQTSPNVAKDFIAQQGLASGVSGGSGKVAIGAANFAENQTLASVYEQVLDAAGFDASVRTIGNRELYEPALEKGEIDVVPEYAGTLTEFLNKKQNGANAKPLASGDLDATVQALQGLAKKAGLVLGQPSEAADQNAFAVTKAFADTNGVSTLSDLSAKCGGGTSLVLGGPPECEKRPFCAPGLEQVYGLTFKSVQSLDAGGPLTQTALRQGRVQVGLVFSSDGGLAGPAAG